MLGSLLPDRPFSDPVLVFALVTLIIFVGPIVFQRLRIPGLVGLIVFGALMGPSAAGFLERDATMILLGTVGLLYLMFYAGLSLNLTEFNRVKGRSVTFGFVSFIIPQLLAVWVGTQYLGYTLTTSFLLGSIVGSHTLLAFPVARRLGITDNPSITMAVGGTMVTDILSLTVLALVVASLGGDFGPVFLLVFAGGVGVFVVALFLGVPPLGRMFFRAVRNQPTAEYSFLLVVLFVSAYAAQVVGLAPIIGAFLAGLVLNRLVPESGALMNRVQFVGDALLIPFFLISVGLLVDFRVLVESLDVWMAAGVFTGLVLVGKFLAAMLVKLVFRQSWSEGWSNFGLTVPQAAATLAVTLVGFEMELFNDAMVNGVIIMILITCFLGPWLVEQFGRKVALADEAKPFDGSRMPERILIPLANPATADALVGIALMIREPRGEQPLLPLWVAMEDGPEVEARVAEGEKMLTHAVLAAAAADVPVRPITRVDRNIASGIRRAVVEELASTVVIGWAGRVGAQAMIFGTVLDQLLEMVQQAIWVCRLERPMNVTERVVLMVPPFAEREFGFLQAVVDMKALASQLGAELVVLCRKASRDSLEVCMEEAEPELPTRFVELERWGDLVSTLGDLRQENDLLLMLSARRGTVAWQAGLNALPKALAATFPDTNLIIVFPTRRDAAQILAAGASSAAGPAVSVLPGSRERMGVGPDDDFGRPAEVRLELPKGEFPSSLDPLLEQLMPDSEEVRLRVREVMEENNQDYSHQVWPGAMLLDAHCAGVTSTQVAVGVSREGVRFPEVAHPVHLLVLLLNPAEVEPAEHVRKLARLANLMRREKDLDSYHSIRLLD